MKPEILCPDCHKSNILHNDFTHKYVCKDCGKLWKEKINKKLLKARSIVKAIDEGFSLNLKTVEAMQLEELIYANL